MASPASNPVKVAVPETRRRLRVLRRASVLVRNEAREPKSEHRLWPKRNFLERQRQEAKLCLNASESFCFSCLYLKLLVATKRSSRFCVTFSKKVTERRMERVAGEAI
jgi:hypothetical protein